MATPKRTGRSFTDQQLGIALLIALAIMYIPLGPLGFLGIVAELLVLVVAILLLVR